MVTQGENVESQEELEDFMNLTNIVSSEQFTIHILIRRLHQSFTR
jgi:hypothetical protein